MRKADILSRLRESVAEFKLDEIEDVCKEALNSGIPPYKIIQEGMAKGMNVVGQRFEAGEYFLSELIAAGETMKKGMVVIEPHLKAEEAKSAGRVVIGTVQGDLHDRAVA